MDFIQFFLRHTPFWAVPIMIIGVQFGYTFWLKDRRASSFVFFAIGGISVLFIIYYMWAGGPEGTPRHFHKLIMGY